MKKVYKAAFRDLYFNKARSLVVILSLVMVISFPIAMINVSDNLNTIIEDEEDTYQLAYYNFFFENVVNSSLEQKIVNWISDYLQMAQDNIIVEGRLHFNTKAPSQGHGSITNNTWLDIDLISYNYSNPNKINQLVLDNGRYPENGNEIVILTSLAKADGIKINDTFTLYSILGPTDYEVVGFVQSIEYASYELSQTGAAYTNLEGLNRLSGRNFTGSAYNSYTVYFKEDVSLEELRDTYFYLRTKFENDADIEFPLVFVWFTRETSFRKSMQDALALTSRYLSIASLFIFLVAGVIIFVTMNRYVNEQKRIIGSMYAYGINKRELIQSFIFRIFLLSIISVIIGLILSKLFLIFLVKELGEKWGLITTRSEISAESIILTILGASIIAYGFTFIALVNLIRLTPYEAMRGKTNELKNFGILFKIVNIIPSRLIRGAMKNLTRNRTRTILTVIAFMISITFSGSLLYTHSSVSSTIDDYYQDKLFYDLEINLGYDLMSNLTLVNELLAFDTNNNGINDITKFEPVLSTFLPFANEPEKLSFLIAVPQNTTMLSSNNESLSQGRWFKSTSNEIVISRYVAGTLGLEIGNTYEFNLFNKQLNLTVVGIMNELMLSSTIIADINYLSSVYLGPVPGIFANKVLANIEEGLDPDEIQDKLNKEYTLVNIALTKAYYKSRFTSLSNSQTVIIYLLIILGLIVGFVSVLTTLLISISERERELGLLHVFGNFNYETFLQIVIEGLLLGALGVIPGILLAQRVSDQLWNQVISETLFEITHYNTVQVFWILAIFTFITILISVIMSYYVTTKKRLAEIIRSE